MREKLIQYVNSLFSSAEPSPQVSELHDEILQNTLDRFDEECSKGADEQSAYQRAVSGIGDIETILAACSPVRSRHSRLYRTTAILLYVFCIFPMIFLEFFGSLAEAFGIFLMFAMIAAATALLVLAGKPKSRTHKLRAAGIGLYILCPTAPVLLDELVSGELGDLLGVLGFFLLAAAATLLVVFAGGQKASVAAQESANAPEPKPVRSLAWRIGTPLYWIFTALVFCMISSFGYWYYGWLIFILAAALGDVITGTVLLLRHGFGGRKLADGLLWLMIVGIYALLTSQTGAWAVTWLLFPIGAALSGVISGISDLVKGASK